MSNLMSNIYSNRLLFFFKKKNSSDKRFPKTWNSLKHLLMNVFLEKPCNALYD